MASNSMPALSPSPSSAAQASSSTHANSIMRPIQTHVRVLGYPEYFHYSRDRILTLSKLKHNGSKGKGVVDTSAIVPPAPAAEGTLLPPEDPLDSSNIICEARLANLHPYGQSTERFFEAAVAPCIESALSGQSFVFLVTGPGRSGRSQTVYGDNTKTKGLVELTAERLLQMVGEGDYLSRKGAAGGASVSPSNANRAFGAAANSMAPTVTYSCYGCSGNNVFETVTNEPVELREFPAPLGLIPLPKMSLLEIPRHAVCIPKNKNASYFTQFQIVKPLSGASGADGAAATTPAATPSSSAASSANARRCAQATITFVDLVQVVGVGTSTVSPDLVALINAVSACSGGGGGGAGAGVDPQFGRCALTRLLEQSIVGTTTMIPIATVTGLSDFFDDTTATLKLVESFGRIHQVMSLLNIVVPSWLRAAYEDMRQTEAENDAQLTSAYQRGCYEAYTAITKVLGGEEARARKESAVFDGIAEKVAELRSATYKTVGEENAKVAALIAAEKDEADAAEAQVSRDSGYLRNQQFVNNCEDDVRRHEALIARLRTETESVISDCKVRIAHHSANASKREREEAESEEEERALKKAIVQRVAAWGRRVEDVSAACVVDKSLKWVEEVKSDIDRLERYVTEGSMRAKNATTAERMDRELRARLLRVTQLERQVEELRHRQQAQHQQHYQMSANQYQDPNHLAVPRGESVASSSVSIKDDVRDGHSNSRRRSTTPRTSRATLYGAPPPPNTSTTRKASAAPSTAPTSRYLQPTSASALRQSSLTGNSPSTSPGSKFTTSSTRNPAGIRPSTAHHPSSSSYTSASDRQNRPAGSSAFSPLGKALSMTTNAVVSVQSILGSKFGGRSAASSPASDVRDEKEKNAAARGAALGSTASLQSRQSSRSSLVPSHVPTTRPNTGNSSAYSPSRAGGLSSASSSRLVNNTSPTSTLAKKPSAVASAAAAVVAARRGVGMTPSKILAPLNGCDEDDDDAASAHYSTTFIASP